MKNFFVISMLISFAMICSCQKQDLAAEQQLAKRKAELDAREKALDEREKALAERESVTTNIRKIPASIPRPVKDPAQVKAEREKRLQQLPPEVQSLIADPARVTAEKEERDKTIQERLAQRQSKMEELQRMRNSRVPAKSAMMPYRGAAASPQAVASPEAAVSPEAVASSPTPSPTPQ
jgi:DNA repair exonuclease SbcCD ATPase subunit